MNKRTFQVGDRVIFESCFGPGESKWRKGVILSEDLRYYYVLRDDGVEGITKPPGYTAKKEETKHDTDFQVGDWVRYEGVDSESLVEMDGEMGRVTRADSHSVGVNFTAYHNPNAWWVRDNLVKIQPPQEEKMDIRSKEDGTIVRDVTEAHEYGYKWVKYLPGSRTEYSWEYWEPVEEWVKIEVRKSQWETINTQIGTFEAWVVDQNYHTVSWRPAK